MLEMDLPQVAAIEQACFSLPWSEKSFREACTKPENIYLVCENEEAVAGYCGMWTVLGEGSITNMAVAEAYRNQGVGAALLLELQKRGKEKAVNVLFLEVRESNVAARRLYEKMGFQDIGRRRNFYERPAEDALVMSKICRQQ